MRDLSGEHLAALAATVALSALLVAGARRNGTAFSRPARLILGAVILAGFAGEQLAYAERGEWSARVNLPFQLSDAVTLVNTVMGLAIDPETRTFRLGSGERGGGLSGPAIHPVAVRAVHDVHAAHPDLPIIGVGGVRDAATARDLLEAGAVAVQVGTATFADPRATAKVLAGLRSTSTREA